MEENKKLTILVDMDDTIEYLLDAWVKYLDFKYGLDVKTEEICDWDLSKAFPTLTKQQVFDVLCEKELWETVKPMPNAGFILKKLKDEGNRVFIVTSSYYKTLVHKMDLVLFKYFPFLKWEDVIVAYKKQMIVGDVLVDDGPHNLIGGDFKKILMSSPHNRNFCDSCDNDVIRCDNWLEVYDEIKKISSNID